jgi:fructose-1,6-bisphosphatase/inositol monophosphatase family enzyme
MSPELPRLRELPGFVEPSSESLRRFLDGEIDAIVSIGGLVWDHAPLILLAEEAGGTFRDREGGRRLDLIGGIYGNAQLVAELGATLAWF